ncbi:MAG: hypothetical protein JSW54_06060 [Fidelibacterota bacterium]|nr:MAG: hypothetical protein JSW54_06060 [Candidatus Neomarinimicrobiota bacterium]
MKTIPLSPVDHIFTGVGSYPIEFIFAYDYCIEAARLQQSLDKTLEHFSPLRSRLIRIADHTYGFQSTEAALTIDEAHSSSAFVDSQDVSAFLNCVQTIEGEPLARIKLTQTPEGSVLGISISHALADGFSFFHFLSSWARIFQSQPIMSPAHERVLLIPEVSDRHHNVTTEDVFNRCGLFWDEKRRSTPRDQITWDKMSLSRAELNHMIAEAQKECGIRLSHNDVITAYLWQNCITAWGQGEDNPSTYIACPVDFRRILDTLPNTYFGSAVCIATAMIDLESLVASSLGELASLVRKAVGQVNSDYVRESLRTLEGLRHQHGLAVLEEIHVMHPRHGLLVTNLTRLPIQELDFGSGIPAKFEIQTAAARGAVILPAPDGVDVRIYPPPGADRE